MRQKEGVMIVSAQRLSSEGEEHLFEVKSVDLAKVGFDAKKLWDLGIIKIQPFSGISRYEFIAREELEEIVF